MAALNAFAQVAIISMTKPVAVMTMMSVSSDLAQVVAALMRQAVSSVSVPLDLFLMKLASSVLTKEKKPAGLNTKMILAWTISPADTLLNFAAPPRAKLGVTSASTAMIFH